MKSLVAMHTGGRLSSILTYISSYNGRWACCTPYDNGTIDCDNPTTDQYPGPAPSQLATVAFISADGTASYATATATATGTNTSSSSPSSPSSSGIGAGAAASVWVLDLESLSLQQLPHCYTFATETHRTPNYRKVMLRMIHSLGGIWIINNNYNKHHHNP